MKKLFRYSTLAVGLALGTGVMAHAYDRPWPHDPGPGHEAPSAPEVDPSLAFSGITLLAGTLTVMRARKRK
ncbi:hypothetical protein HNQ77_004646 [Silvibacterium bohemicum]|jgi:hypothetical protein|uniref:Uncharacterized protein n=1 Tax=Silvibacterium bohemicum TaxID=1577686 RepID=A0A841K249_9BACT|nr:hypothetical protein [Silvibacterium bohemicum]